MKKNLPKNQSSLNLGIMCSVAEGRSQEFRQSVRFAKLQKFFVDCTYSFIQKKVFIKTDLFKPAIRDFQNNTKIIRFQTGIRISGKMIKYNVTSM